MLFFRKILNGDRKQDPSHEGELQEFDVLDEFFSQEVTTGANTGGPGTVGDVVTIPPLPTSPATSSPYTPVSHTHVDPLVSTLSKSHDGLVRHKSITNIYTKEVTIVTEENEVMIAISKEPTCYQEATIEACWYKATEKELEFIEKNNTWTLKELPSGHKLIGLK